MDAYAIPDFEMGSVPGRFELLHKVKEYLVLSHDPFNFAARCTGDP